LDLVLTSAVCHYFLGVRWGGLPAWTIVPVAAFGLTLSRIILPAGIGDAGLVPLLALAVVEGAVLVLAIVRITKISAAFREARRDGAHRLDAFQLGLLALGPHAAPLARWARLELEIFSLALAGWRRPHVPSSALAFTHHRAAGWSAIAGALALLLIVEGVVLHLWLQQAGHTIAMWTAFGLHAYGLVWVMGDALALRNKRTLLIANGRQPMLDVNVGVRGHGRFPLSRIATVTSGTWEAAGTDERLVNVAGPANVKLTFDRPMSFQPMFGAAVEVQGLLVQVDEPERFVRELRTRMFT
jgi:hypothetical protein